MMERNYSFSFNLNETSKSSLDVLLELIKKKKMNIKELNILDLTNQFILYFEEHKHSISLEEYSDYANMSAYLIELKTRSLLPDSNMDLKNGKQKYDLEQEAFIRRLLEYEMYRRAIPLLDKYKNKRAFFLDKSPDDYDEYLPSSIPLAKLPKRLNVDKLSEAFERVLQRQVLRERLEKPVDLHMSSQEYTVDVVISDLLVLMQSENSNFISFIDLFNKVTVEKQNIDYFCMLFFVILSLVNKNYLILNMENDEDFKIKLNCDSLQSTEQITNFIEDIRREMFGDD